MKNLTNKQNFQIAYKSGKLKDLNITCKCYIFVSGYDKNSTDAENITAYGLQHASMLTAEDNSKDINEKLESVLLADGERVLIDGVEYITHLIGDYSDAVHFEEVGYKELVELNTTDNIKEGKITRGEHKGYIGRFCHNGVFEVYNAEGKSVEQHDGNNSIESEIFDHRQITKIRLFKI